MARREIIECDGCGMQLPPDRWTIYRVEYQADHQDFCSRACLVKHLGGSGAPHPYLEPKIPEAGNWMWVKVGSFAWAMQRVKDGATVRRVAPPDMSAPLDRAAFYHDVEFNERHLAGEWEEVP